MFGKLFEKLTVTHVTGHAEKRRGPVMNADPHSIRSMGSLSRVVKDRIFPPFAKGRLPQPQWLLCMGLRLLALQAVPIEPLDYLALLVITFVYQIRREFVNLEIKKGANHFPCWSKDD